MKAPVLHDIANEQITVQVYTLTKNKFFDHLLIRLDKRKIHVFGI